MEGLEEVEEVDCVVAKLSEIKAYLESLSYMYVGAENVMLSSLIAAAIVRAAVELVDIFDGKGDIPLEEME